MTVRPIYLSRIFVRRLRGTSSCGAVPAVLVDCRPQLLGSIRCAQLQAQPALVSDPPVHHAITAFHREDASLGGNASRQHTGRLTSRECGAVLFTASAHFPPSSRQPPAHESRLRPDLRSPAASPQSPGRCSTYHGTRPGANTSSPICHLRNNTLSVCNKPCPTTECPHRLPSRGIHVPQLAESQLRSVDFRHVTGSLESAPPRSIHREPDDLLDRREL